MSRRSSKKCEHSACNKHASFGAADSTERRWCSEHKPLSAVNLSKPRCEHLGCGLQASFRLNGSSQKRWCGTHRPAEAVYKTAASKKLCEHQGCEKQASFGTDGGPVQKRWCKEHKPAGACRQQQTFHTVCWLSGCTELAKYGPGPVDARHEWVYCSRHAPQQVGFANQCYIAPRLSSPHLAPSLLPLALCNRLYVLQWLDWSCRRGVDMLKLSLIQSGLPCRDSLRKTRFDICQPAGFTTEHEFKDLKGIGGGHLRSCSAISSVASLCFFLIGCVWIRFDVCLSYSSGLLLFELDGRQHSPKCTTTRSVEAQGGSSSE